VASGINNGVSRIAGLLAIAVLGAVIAGSFKSNIDNNLGGAPLSSKAERVIDEAKTKPLAVPDTGGLAAQEADRVAEASADASEKGFHEGMMLSGALMIIGGVIAGFGIQNPRRPGAERQSPRAAPAGECARCAEDGHDGRHHEHDQTKPVSA
jgi:hypothetical protein